MIKFIGKTSISALIFMLLLPSIALAERGAVTLKRAEDQRNQSRSASLDPYNAENQEVLETFGIELQPVDPLWQDPEFAYFMELIKESYRLDEAGDTVNAFYTFFEGIDVMDGLNHRALVLPKEERELLDRLRAVIENNKIAFEADPEYFLGEQLLLIVGEELEKAFVEYEQSLGVNEIYAYANPGGYVYPGEMVRLQLSTTEPEGLTVSWRQTYGPNVEWLKTDSSLQTAFLVPENADGESLIFEYTISRLGETKTGKIDLTVFENPYSVFVAPEDAITNLYQSLLGRNPDPDGYVYWKQKYDAGMSLNEIATIFMQSEEYQNLHR